MKIIVGSKNAAKIAAVQEIIAEYPHLAGADVVGVEAGSNVSDQPKSLDETMDGAMNRARAAFNECDYSVGLESGLMSVSKSRTGYMDVCVCAIYDGKEFYFGLSSAWEFPNGDMWDLIFNQDMTMEQAVNHLGYTKNPKVGSAEGIIGILTKGRLNRKEYTKEALRGALIHLDP